MSNGLDSARLEMVRACDMLRGAVPGTDQHRHAQLRVTAAEEQLTVWANRGNLATWLRTSPGADVLDDAVLGCLLDSTVLDVLDDHELPDDANTRRWFAREIDAALAEGN